LALGVSKAIGAGHAGSSTPQAVVIVAYPENLRALIARYRYGPVAPGLRSAIPGINVLKEDSVADDVVASELVTVEVAVSRILAGFDRRPRASRERSELSNREVEVLGHVASGMSNKEVARRLGISQPTVRKHLSHACAKLHATNRTAAVAYAIRSGLLGP
jgi:DNA-binding CsgD family transcriptional regulator